MLVHANSGNFEKEVLKAKGIVVVDFWAEWCGPCKRYGPVFEEAAKELESKAKFVKVDVEEAQDIAAEYGVMSIPTTLSFKDGQPVQQGVGIIPKETLKNAIAQLQ